MRPGERIRLSDTGQQRRDAMLGELIHAMDSHHRSRGRRIRSVCGALALLTVAAVYFFVAQGSGTPATPAVILAKNTTTTRANQPAANILRIATDPTIVDRYRTTNSSCAIVLSDTDLLRALREINRPAGLVRMDGEVWLTASVVGDAAYDTLRPNSL